MAGGEAGRAEIARSREQVAKLDGVVALDAGHRRFARGVARREAVDHRLAEPGLIIENVMRNANALGDRARVMNVLAGAARGLRAPWRAP